MIEKYLRRTIVRTYWEEWVQGEASKFIKKKKH
jgi:hypothetical protein